MDTPSWHAAPRASNHTMVGQFDGFIEIESRDVETLMEAVYKFGPISVAVDAGTVLESCWICVAFTVP